MKISIITVVKNDIKNIYRTLNSVIKQNYINKEYIIIDGNSTDGTFEEVAWFLKKSKKKNIFLFKKKDKSMYDAINFGIRKASGNIIGLLHSGDIFYNNLILTNIIKYFKNYNMVSGNVVYKNKMNLTTRIWNYKLKNLNSSSFFKVAHTSLFLKKDLIKIVGKYDLRYKISSDTDYLIRLSRNKKVKYKYIKKFFIKMNDSGLSTSNKTLFLKIKEDLKIYYRYFKFYFVFMYVRKILFKLYNYIIWKIKIN